MTFFSKVPRDAKLRYNIIKAPKHFRMYILHSMVIAYVPSSVVDGILVQLDNEGKHGKWIARLLEYGVEIKPIKLIKG